MDSQKNQNNRKNNCEEVTFIVRNHTKKDEHKICLPITKNRANNLKKAKKVFLCVSSYFEKEISETLILYQKVGIDENGRDKFEKIAGCIVRNGNRELIEFTPEAIIS